MFLEERRQAILALLQAHGRVSVTDLGQRFGVSEVTIRVDLQVLADQGLVVRTHGGAIPVGYGTQELSLLRRRQRQVAEKPGLRRLLQNWWAMARQSSLTAAVPHWLSCPT